MLKHGTELLNGVQVELGFEFRWLSRACTLHFLPPCILTPALATVSSLSISFLTSEQRRYPIAPAVQYLVETSPWRPWLQGGHHHLSWSPPGTPPHRSYLVAAGAQLAGSGTFMLVMPCPGKATMIPWLWGGLKALVTIRGGWGFSERNLPGSAGMA